MWPLSIPLMEWWLFRPDQQWLFFEFQPIMWDLAVFVLTCIRHSTMNLRRYFLWGTTMPYIFHRYLRYKQRKCLLSKMLSSVWLNIRICLRSICYLSSQKLTKSDQWRSALLAHCWQQSRRSVLVKYYGCSKWSYMPMMLILCLAYLLRLEETRIVLPYCSPLFVWLDLG